MKDAIKAVLATQSFDESVNAVNLTEPDWVVAKELLDFFSIFVKTTTIMQADNYPTVNRTLPEYFRLIRDLETVENGTDRWNIRSQAIREAATAALAKMNEYFAKNHASPTAFVATMCDPRFKLAIFESLWKNDSAYIARAKRHFKNCYQSYKHRESKLQAVETLNAEPQRDSDDDEGEEDDDLFADYHGRPTLSTSEHDSWFAQGTLPYKTGDIKAFWLSKGYDFKVIAQMAKDHLGVPATSAASERVFSNGGDIITKRRCRLGGKNTRYLLCLRDWGLLVEAEEEDDVDDDECEAEDGAIIVE